MMAFLPAVDQQVQPVRAKRSKSQLPALFFAVVTPIVVTILVQYSLYGAAGGFALFASAVNLLILSTRLRTAEPRELRRITADIVLSALIAALGLIQLASSLQIENTKLYRLHLPGYTGIESLSQGFLYLIWSLTLACFPFALRSPSRVVAAPVWNRGAANTLAILGLIGLAITFSTSRADAFSSRGEASGNGLSSLLYWASAVYVVYVILKWRKGNGIQYAVFAWVCVFAQLATGNRSPIALIAIALLLKLVISRRAALIRMAIFASPLILGVFSYQSTWRSLVAHGLDSSVTAVLAKMTEDPIASLLGLGLDSIDGHVLVQDIVQSGFDPRWTDPLVAVLNFIPRQIWPDKPTLLGSEIGHDYLDLTAGGIFLSGPGYLALVTGSLILGAAVFVAFTLGLRVLLYRSNIDIVHVCAVVYLIARFPVAGDAFDIFLALQVSVIYMIAVTAGGFRWKQR